MSTPSPNACNRPTVHRIQRFVTVSTADFAEGLILTFSCDGDAEYVCFERVHVDGGEVYGTYLSMPNGEHALIEGVVGPNNEVLSIIPGKVVEQLLGLRPGEGDKYVCLSMSVKADRYYTITFHLHKSIKELAKAPSPLSKLFRLVESLKPYYDSMITDVVTTINSPKDGQRQYVRVIFKDEHMELKEEETTESLQDGLRKIVTDLGKIITMPSGLSYSFRITPSSTPPYYLIQYNVTLRSFYKAFAWIYLLTAMGAPLLSLFLILMGLLMPLNDYVSYLAATTPILTTMILLILSSYLLLPKDWPLKITVFKTLAYIDAALILALIIFIIVKTIIITI